jgi:hypothetical protein
VGRARAQNAQIYLSPRRDAGGHNHVEVRERRCWRSTVAATSRWAHTVREAAAVATTESRCGSVGAGGASGPRIDDDALLPDGCRIQRGSLQQRCWSSRSRQAVVAAPARVRRCGSSEYSRPARHGPAAHATGRPTRLGFAAMTGKGEEERQCRGLERGGGCAGQVLDETPVSLLWW